MKSRSIYKLSQFLLLALLLWPVSGHSEGEQLFEADLIQQHHVIMLLIDAESGAVVDANQAAANYYGYSRSQLQQMNIRQINTLSRDQVEQEYRRAQQEQRNYFLFKHQLADGSVRTVEVYSSPVTVAGRTLLFSIINDVGKEQSYHHALAVSETRLRFAEQVASIGHWTLDLATDTYEFSEGAMALLGLDQNIWPAAKIRVRIAEEYWQQMVELRHQLIANTRQYRIDVRFERPDGMMIDLRSEGIYDPDRQTIFGILHDTTPYHEAMRALTSRTSLFLLLAGFGLALQVAVIALLIVNANRRKKVEAQLRESEQRFDQQARQNRSVIWEVDANGLYTYVSEGAHEVFGYNPQEITGRMHFYDLHPEEGRAQFKADSFEVFRQKATFNDLENPIVTRSGMVIWVSTTAMPLLDKKGRLLGYRGSDIDITDRKHAQRALEIKNQEMEQFVYAVSHDLKSPLITVRTYLDILKEDMSNDQTAETEAGFQYMDQATEKMAQLLDALYHLSQAGHLKEETTPLSVNDLVSSCLSSLSGALKRRQVTITVADFPQILQGDPLRLEQVWQNLMENAIKYMGDQPQPQIDIGYEDAETGPVFFVCDNGMGIEPQHLERVFGLFSQLHHGSEGIGFGLALVKKIVERYHGKIWVESGGRGQGSCFKFTLPGCQIRHDIGSRITVAQQPNIRGAL